MAVRELGEKIEELRLDARRVEDEARAIVADIDSSPT
ncbi:MAG: hypothetical protein ACI9R3_003852 [Verrucomicrobiales bacterium]|jgi:hypothetical protein